MRIFNENLTVLVAISIFFLVLCTFNDFHFSYKCPQRNGEQRILFENLSNAFSEKSDIYSSTHFYIQNFVEMKLKNNNDNNTKKKSGQKDKEEDLKKKCENPSKNILTNLFKKIRNSVLSIPSDTQNCINSEKYKKFNENFRYIMENNVSIESTPVCLIDTGIDTKYNLIKHFLNYENETGDYDFSSSKLRSHNHVSYGINTESCNEYNYSYCKSSNLEDSKNHGTFVANTIIQSELLKEKKIFKKNISFVVCKAFGKKGKSQLFPLIKCLEYCKMRNVKIIHVSYNIIEKNEKLIEVMDELKRSQIIVVSPSQNIYKSEENEKNDDEYSKMKFYPSSFAENYENIFSIGALEYSQQYKNDKIKVKLLDKDDKEVLNRENTTLFNFSYKTDLSIEDDSFIEDARVYASASFVANLVVMLNINPKLSLSKIREILKESIVVDNELKKLSAWGGYINLSKAIEKSLIYRRRFYKLFYLEIDEEKQKKFNDTHLIDVPNNTLRSNALSHKPNNKIYSDQINTYNDDDFIGYKGNGYITEETEKQYHNLNHSNNYPKNSPQLEYDGYNNIQGLLDNTYEDIAQKGEDENYESLEKDIRDDTLRDQMNEMFYDNDDIFNNERDYDYNSKKGIYKINKPYSYDENDAISIDKSSYPLYGSFLQTSKNEETIPKRRLYKNYPFEDADYKFKIFNENNSYNNENYENKNENSYYSLDEFDNYNNNDANYKSREMNSSYEKDILPFSNESINSSKELFPWNKGYSTYLEEPENYKMPQLYDMQMNQSDNINTKKSKSEGKDPKHTSRYPKQPKSPKKNKQKVEQSLSEEREQKKKRNLPKKRVKQEKNNLLQKRRRKQKKNLLQKKGRKEKENFPKRSKSKVKGSRKKEASRTRKSRIMKKPKGESQRKQIKSGMTKRSQRKRRIPGRKLLKNKISKNRKENSQKKASNIIKHPPVLPSRRVKSNLSNAYRRN